MANRTVAVDLVLNAGRYISSANQAASATQNVGTGATTAGTRAQRGFDMAGRGAALLAGVVSGGLAVSLKGAIDLAANAEQSIGGVEAVFKGYAKSVIADSQEADRALGLSANSYRELATTIGSQLKNAGIPMEDLAAQTSDLISMGADLAAMFGGTTEEAVQALSSALKGEMDPIEAYGISLNDAALQAEAAALGLEVLGGSLTNNQRAMAVMSLVTKQGADAVGAFGREQDTAAGRAARASAQWENLQTTIGEKLLPAWSALMDFIGEDVIPGLETVGGAIAAVGGFMMDNTGIVAALAAILGIQLVGGITAVTVALNRMVFTPVVLGLVSLMSAVLGLPGAMAGAAAAIGTFMTAVAPLLAIGTVVLATVEFMNVANAAGEAREEVKGMWDAVGEGRGQGQLDELAQVVEQIRAKVAELRGNLADDGAWETTILGALLTGALEDTKALEEYERQLRLAEEAQRSAASTASVLAAQWGVSSEQVLALAEKYGVDLTAGAATATSALYGARAAAQVEGEASADAALSTEFYAEELQGAADAASEAKKQTDLFKMSLDILTGAHVTMIEAESALQSALAAGMGAMDDLTGSVLQANGQLNLQSEAGRAAADVLLGVRDSGNQLIATMIEQGASAEDVRAKDAQLREGFIRTAEQMGISRQAAENLANQILGIPEERETKIDADTRAASQAVADFQDQIDNLHGKTVEIQANWANGGTLNGSMRFDFADGGIVKYFADGGHENHVAQHAPAGAWRVWAEPETGGETYIPHAPAKRARSRQIWAETGHMLNFFADGGINASPNAIAVRADFSPVADFAREAAADVRKLLEPVTGMVGALNWARTQVGKPYLWGGAGPTGYDCSGFMSALTNYIRGKSPYSRVGSTATFPWPGFAPGYGSFTIGSTPNAGGGIGHMAGTLLGVNVESAGGVGVRVGSSARGASDGLFGTRAHLAMASGGVIGEPVSGRGMWSGRSYSFAERGDEVVLPRSREFSGGGSGGIGGGSTRTVHHHYDVVAGPRAEEVARAIATQQRQQEALAPAW